VLCQPSQLSVGFVLPKFVVHPYAFLINFCIVIVNLGFLKKIKDVIDLFLSKEGNYKYIFS
jgi:hypothetical protein